MNQSNVNYPGYLIHSILAEGPVTIVFNAFEVERTLPCVIKSVRSDYPYEKQASAFLKNEISLLQTIKHPALPVLQNLSLVNIPIYFVMERIDGVTLRQELNRKFSLTFSSVVNLTRQILSLLSCLHQEGFTHGDIKPENILIEPSGKVRVIDLAFSSNVKKSEKIETNLMIGTPNYIAPELCADIPLVTLANDIYSLGVVIFEILTGTLPFPEGTVSQTLVRHQSDPPARLKQKLAPYDPKLTHIIIEMLSCNPIDRPKVKSLLDFFVKIELEAMVNG